MFVLKFHRNVAFLAVFHGVCFMMERMAFPKRLILSGGPKVRIGGIVISSTVNQLTGREAKPLHEYKGRIQGHLENGI